MGGFDVEPKSIEVSVNPGDVINKYITVTNREAEPTRFKIEIEDFEGSNEKGREIILLGDEKSPYSLKDNLIPEKIDFILKPGEKMSVPIKIEVPSLIKPGGYYAAVLVSDEPTIIHEGNIDSDGQVRNMARVISRQSSLFFVRVNGLIEGKGYLKDFYILDRQLSVMGRSFLFESSFQNDGMIYLAPSGTTTVRDIFGRVMATIPVGPYFVLPDSTRYTDIVWNDSSFLFGKYTATIEMHLGYGTETNLKTITFWIIPWRILVLALAILVIVGLVAYRCFCGC